MALLFSVVNLYSYLRMPEYFSMDDGFVHFRWPFSVYAYGGFWTHSVIIWTGIVGNVFVALCAHRIVQGEWPLFVVCVGEPLKSGVGRTKR